MFNNYDNFFVVPVIKKHFIFPEFFDVILFYNIDPQVLLINNDNLMSVETVNTKPNPKWTNACAKANGGCSHLCLVTPAGRVCDCPNGYEITGQNGVKCVVPEAFLLYTRKSEIGRVSITTPNHNGYILPIKGLS
jgi:low density lipoprotein receptor-related protein 5/6